ncbi:nucleotide-binding alpha-beta plait domain-containing protein, partial [Tanacetum coccineum]
MRDKATSYFFTNFPDYGIQLPYGRCLIVMGSFEKRLKGIMIGEAKIVFMKAAGKTIPVNSNKNLPRQQPRFHMDDFPLSQGTTKNFEVLQNAWDIIKNNGLDDCNIKYMGGLSFLFEWPSKEAAEKSLEANLIWIQQWFDDVKMWNEDGEPYVRLAWINFEGIPVLARNLNTVKLVAKDIGKLLEVGRLDFDVSVLQQVKTLILVPCMEDINQVINVKLNGRKYIVKANEDRQQ